MSSRVDADPHLLVRWRDCKAGDAGELRGGDHRPMVGLDVGEGLALAQPPDAGVGVGYVDEPGRDSHFRCLGHQLGHRLRNRSRQA